MVIMLSRKTAYSMLKIFVLLVQMNLIIFPRNNVEEEWESVMKPNKSDSNVLPQNNTMKEEEIVSFGNNYFECFWGQLKYFLTA
ncbi:hypothetical protein BGP_6199 [Beggiatoa sp. PS]|nr:hypothetical protein BGP_6199 [Beggiatoa sp. PS]